MYAFWCIDNFHFLMPILQLGSTTIAVDNFKHRSNDTFYFLTHYHSDHFLGITTRSIVYTGELTGKFV